MGAPDERPRFESVIKANPLGGVKPASRTSEFLPIASLQVGIE